jgi:hypothetical protein
MMNWRYSYAMREDSNKKLYLYYNSKDVLYYNFGLNKIDTFTTPQGIQMVVDSVDNVSLFNNEKRMRFFLSSEYGNCEQWIEGIGSINGLTDVGFCGIADAGSKLICFTENDTLKYHDSGYNSCYFKIVGIYEIKNKVNSIFIIPNPANELLIISYTLLENTKVVMSIYDITGRKLDIIENGVLRMEKGEHRINYDVGKLNDGIYFCRIQVGNEKLTKKIVIVH